MSLNLGELYTQITLNTDSLNRAIPSIEKLEKAVNKLSTNIDKMTTAMSGKFVAMANAANASADKVAQNRGYAEFFGSASKSAEESASVFVAAFTAQEQKAKQAEATNKALVKEEQASVKAKTAARKAYYKEVEKGIKEQEKLETNAVKHLLKKNAIEEKSAKSSATAYQAQLVSITKTEQEIEKLSAAYRSFAGGQKYVDELTRSLNLYKLKVGTSVISTEDFKLAQHTMRNSIEKTKLSVIKTAPQLNQFQVHLSEMAKTATIALGPLNGVASRITALTSIAKASAVPMALLLGGLAGFAVLAGKSIIAGAKMESAIMQMDHAMKGMGATTGLTGSQLNAMAIGLAEATLTSTAFAREAATALQAFKGVGDNTERVLYLAQDLSQTFGGGLMENTKRLGRVMEDPIKGLEGLSEAGIRFTESEKRVIKSLVETGNASKASGMILDKISERVGGAGTEAAKGLAGAWDTLGERITAFVEKIGGVETKGGTLAATISEISDTLKEWTQQAGLAENIGGAVGSILKFIANTALFMAKNMELLTLVTIGYAVGGITSKLVPALKVWGLQQKARIAEIYATNTAVTVLGKGLKALRALIASTGIGAVAAIVGMITAEYLLFSDSAEEAADSQERVNKAVDEGAEAHKRLRAAMTSQQRGVDDLNTFLDGYKTRLAAAQEMSAKGLRINPSTNVLLTEEISYLQATIKALEEGAQHLSKTIVLKGTENDIRLIQDRYLEVRDSILSSTDAAYKFSSAVNIAKGLVEKVGIENLTAEQKRFVEVVNEMKAAGGAFIDVKQKVADVQRELSKAKTLANVAFTSLGENETAKMVDEINEAFSKQDDVRKWTDYLQKLTPEAMAVAAAQAGINTQNKSGAALVREMASALSAQSAETRRLAEAQRATEQANKMMDTTADKLAALNSLTVGQKIAGFFSPEIVANALNFNLAVSETASALQNLENSGGDLSSLRRELIETAKAGHFENLLKGLDLSKIDDLALGMERVKSATEKAAVSFEAFQNLSNQLMGQMTQIIATQLSMYQELASYHKQMAQDALAYGQSQATMYMNLADTVHYSNNEQAKSFEDRAIAAASAAAKQYRAEKAAQDKANIAAKKAFENQKKLQIASIMMDTASAAMKAFSSLASIPYVGPALGAAAAAAVVALGAKQVSTVKQQQYTPRERGGPITGGKPYLVGEKGPEFIIPNRGGTVIPNSKIGGLMGSGGDVNVTFQVETLDASSFDRMLMTKRSMIIGMVRQAADKNMRNTGL